MVNWKRAGLLAAISVLMYASWCAAPVAALSRKSAKTPVFFSGHYESGNPDEEGIESIIGVRERIYNDAVLFDLQNDWKDDANIYFSSPKVPVGIRPDLAWQSGGAALVEVHYHGNMDGCVVNYSPDNTLADGSKRLAGLISEAMTGNDAEGLHVLPALADNSLYVLNHARVPSVAVVCGNIRTVNGHQLAITDSFRRSVSLAITNGVRDYIR